MELKLLSKNPEVTVIIPCLDEEEYIGKLIDSINADSYKNKEVIIVDDGSRDKTVEIAKSKGATVLINKPGRRGPAFGWNRAAKYTDAELIVILDADCTLSKNFLQKCVNAFDEKTVAVFPAFRTIQDRFLEKIVTAPRGFALEPKMIRKDIYLQLGGFPEIGFGEDQILADNVHRFVKKNNLNEKFVKEAYFAGHGVHSLKAMYKQAKWYGKTGLMFVRKFKGLNGINQFITTYLRMIYFLSFISLLLIPINSFFFIASIPFLLIFLLIIARKFTNPYHLLKTITFLIFGLGMLHGLLIYLLGSKGAGH